MPGPSESKEIREEAKRKKQKMENEIEEAREEKEKMKKKLKDKMNEIKEKRKEVEDKIEELQEKIEEVKDSEGSSEKLKKLKKLQRLKEQKKTLKEKHESLRSKRGTKMFNYDKEIQNKKKRRDRSFLNALSEKEEVSKSPKEAIRELKKNKENLRSITRALTKGEKGAFKRQSVNKNKEISDYLLKNKEEKRNKLKDIKEKKEKGEELSHREKDLLKAHELASDIQVAYYLSPKIKSIGDLAEEVGIERDKMAHVFHRIGVPARKTLKKEKKEEEKGS